MNIKARQYAQSLFNIAKQDDNLENFVLYLNQTQANLDEIRTLLNNPQIDKNKLTTILKEFGFDNKFNNFLIILNEQKDLDKIASISDHFKNLVDKETNTLEVELVSATKLTEAQKQEIIKNLKNKFNKNIQLKEFVNKNLIAGIIIKIDDQLFDASIKSKLNELQHKLTA